MQGQARLAQSRPASAGVLVTRLSACTCSTHHRNGEQRKRLGSHLDCSSRLDRGPLASEAAMQRSRSGGPPPPPPHRVLELLCQNRVDQTVALQRAARVGGQVGQLEVAGASGTLAQVAAGSSPSSTP